LVSIVVVGRAGLGSLIEESSLLLGGLIMGVGMDPCGLGMGLAEVFLNVHGMRLKWPFLLYESPHFQS